MPHAQARPLPWGPLAAAAWGLLFVLAATLNTAGYRYGGSDQAFYIPAVVRHVDPALFPRDWLLLAPQDRFNVFTAAVAGGARLTGLSVPHLFVALYVVGLTALFAAALLLGRRLYRSAWTVVALTAALTLRHAVAMGAVNTLEGYMHPRMIAFGVGSLAVAACMARRPVLALLLVLPAVAAHPTTGVWFAAWVAVAVAAADRRLARPLLAAAAAGGALAAWAVLAGPLQGRLGRMDDAWLSILASKTYLFPDRWPLSGWVPALATPVLAAAFYSARARRGLTTGEERGVILGAAVLLSLFVISLPLTAARVTLAVQLQVPRVLWMIDFVAIVYAVWYLAEGAPWTRGEKGRRAAQGLALLLLAASAARGAHEMFVRHPERSFVAIDLPADDWNDAMRWIRDNTAKDAWVLAAPGHAWRYGTSVRVSAHRDVYIEEAKDVAIGLYSREGALQVLERIRRTIGFDEQSAAEYRSLAADTGLHVLVSERPLELPVLYRNARFSVYRLR